MKKMFAVSAVLAIATVAGAQSAHAQESNARESSALKTNALKKSAATSTAGYAAEVTASRLQLRAGASSSYQSVVTVDQGAKLVVVRVASGEWAMVQVPGGFDAWVSAKYITRTQDGKAGTVAGKSLNIRPRPTTRYHQLSGKLLRGETVRVVDEKTVGEDRWLKVRIPQRVALFASTRFLKNIGPVSLAVAPAPQKGARSGAKVAAAAGTTASANAKFVQIEKSAIAKLKGVRSVRELRAIERTLATVDQSRLSVANQTRHSALGEKIYKRKREFMVNSVSADEKKIRADLDRNIKKIEDKYAAERARIQAARDLKKNGEQRYSAVGIIEHRPDVLGRTPAFRMIHGGKLKYYLIAPAFDLRRFSGKRVGVIGIQDRESGTGYYTIMVKRLEIISDK